MVWSLNYDRTFDRSMHISAIRRNLACWAALGVLIVALSACGTSGTTGTSPAIKKDAPVPETTGKDLKPRPPAKEQKSEAEQAREHLKAGQYKKARKAATEAIAKNDKSADKVIIALDREAKKERRLGDRAFKSGDLGKSISHWERALEMNPDAPDIKLLKDDLKNTRLLHKAQEAFDAGDYGKAFEAASSAQDHGLTRGGALELIKKLKALADEQYRKGLRHYVAERMERAIAEWERALEIYPGHERSVRDLKDARRLQKKIEDVR